MAELLELFFKASKKIVFRECFVFKALCRRETMLATLVIKIISSIFYMYDTFLFCHFCTLNKIDVPKHSHSSPGKFFRQNKQGYWWIIHSFAKREVIYQRDGRAEVSNFLSFAHTAMGRVVMVYRWAISARARSIYLNRKRWCADDQTMKMYFAPSVWTKTADGMDWKR